MISKPFSIAVAAMIIAYPCVAETQKHPVLREGDSFLIRQLTEARRELTKLQELRFKVSYENKSNQYVVGVTEGRPANPTQEPVYRIAYVIAKDACVIDVLGGIALRGGENCEGGLPESWVFPYPAFPDSIACRTDGAVEEITVPAGTFTAVTVICARELASPPRKLELTYLYVPAIGVMAKTVRRTYDQKGSLLRTTTELLEAIQIR